MPRHIGTGHQSGKDDLLFRHKCPGLEAAERAVPISPAAHNAEHAHMQPQSPWQRMQNGPALPNATPFKAAISKLSPPAPASA
jgi:hypothetical protein